MPGTVLRVLVAAGDAVAAGQPLVVVEAMKMEHQIVAPAAGTVAEVLVAAGQQVDTGQVLLQMEERRRDRRPARCASPTAPASTATGSRRPGRWSRAARSTCSPATGWPS